MTEANQTSDTMRRIISFLVILAAIAVNARQVTPDEAQTIATGFFNGQATAKPSPKRTARFASMPQKSTGPYYIFNASDGRGFVIISGDTRAKKILGYSDRSSFDTANMPPQLKALLKQFSKAIDTIPTSAPQDPSWENYASSTSEESVLLETANWGQGYPYNAQCPIIDGVQAPTGCIATAMSIIMKYHNWPEVGRYENHYQLYPEGPEYSKDFSEFKPKWQLFSGDDITTDKEAINAIAEIMYAAGIASHINYILDSGTTLIDAMIGLRRFLSFGASLLYLKKSDLTEQKWIELIHNELNNKRPILYSCFQSSDYAGHAFVIDGYLPDNNLLHINWGWDGNFNGYYSLEGLNPAEFSFDTQHQMVIGICPPRADDSLYSDYYMAPDALVDPVYGNLDFFNVSVENITDEPFNCITPSILWPPYSDAKSGLAVVDKNNVIKEVVSDLRFFNSNSDLFFKSSAFTSTEFKTKINPEDRIQLVAQETGEEEWRFVNSSYNRPSYFPVVGNTPKVNTCSWNIDPRLYIEFSYTNKPYPFYVKRPNEEIDSGMSQLLFGLDVLCHVIYDKCNGTNMSAAAKLDGTMLNSQVYDEGCSQGGYLQFTVKYGREGLNPKHIDIDVMGFSSDEERRAYTIVVNNKDDVSSFCAAHYCTDITDIKLSGQGNGDEDLRPIYNNMPFLMSLDLSDYKPKNRVIRPYVFSSTEDGDYNATDDDLESQRGEPWVMKTGLQCLKELRLPSEVDSIKAGAFHLCKVDHIIIPSAVKYIGRWAFHSNMALDSNYLLKYVVCESATPPELEELGFGEVEHCNTILYVPRGSMDNYKTAPEWCKFNEIIEYDGEFVSIDELEAVSNHDNVSIYSLSGLPIYEGRYSEANLDSGIYIVVTSDGRHKRLVK